MGNENRQTYIGSADAPAILGLGYSGENAHTVWLNKIGQGEEREDNDALLCGRLLQPAICEFLAIKAKYDVRQNDQFFRHPGFEWWGATPDAFICGDDRGLGCVETKNVGVYNAAEWKKSDPPLRVAVQLQHQMAATGAKWGIAAGLIGGNRLAWFEMSRHDALIEAVTPVLRRFWDNVRSGIPPAVDGSEGCARMLRKIYPKDDATSILMPPDGEAWFDELSMLKAGIKALEGRQRYIENHIKAAIGGATYGTLPDGRQFSWKTQTRAGYTVEPGTARILRQHGPKAPAIGLETEVGRMAKATADLLALGAVLYHESRSGSRYFELAGGLIVRVADHGANEKTTEWMQAACVADVRTDSDEWAEQLERITAHHAIDTTD